tara:strand:+ start:1071 stop:2942 length:1872 start_codon:yes stop_codon:yes gene_type:complete
MTIYYDDELEMLEMKAMNLIDPIPDDDETDESQITSNKDCELEPHRYSQGEVKNTYEEAPAHSNSSSCGEDMWEPDPDSDYWNEPSPIPDYQSKSEEIEEVDSICRLENALDKQAPTISADFNIDQLLPSTAARTITQSSSRSQCDPIALTMMLITTTGGLLGSKVRVQTQHGKDLAANLYLWLVGDTSSRKTITTQKFVSPLYGVKERALKRLQDAIKAIKTGDSSPEEKKDKIEELKNNQHAEYFESMDISEQGLIRAISKQAPLQGLQIHLDEGSDLFNGVERYSGNKTGSTVTKTGLLRNLLLIGWSNPLRGSGAKVDEERCVNFEEQTFALTANIQQQFLTQIIDIEEDSQGSAARHDVVLINTSNRAMAKEPKGIDPTSELMIDRIIPFCRSIQLAINQETDDTGNRIRYEVCEFSHEAQKLYDDYLCRTKQEAEENLRKEIEPAFTRYLLKVGERLGKIALIQHILEVVEGAKRDSTGFDFDEAIQFSSANKRINIPISKQAMERAINCCILLAKQRQLVIDSTRSAPMKREAQLRLGELQQKLSHVLDKLENLCIEYGPQSRSKFIANTKGTKGMSRQEVEEIIKALISRDCIQETKKGKAVMLEWVKPLRSARC